MWPDWVADATPASQAKMATNRGKFKDKQTFTDNLSSVKTIWRLFAIRRMDTKDKQPAQAAQHGDKLVDNGQV